MTERTFQKLLDIQATARALDRTIEALTILPKYDANQSLISFYKEQVEKLVSDMKEELK